MPKWLEKLLSKQAFEKATDLIQEQPTPATREEATENHTRVVEGLVAFIEDLDDRVELIPFAGPILKMLVDSPQVDAKERELAAFVVESVYRTLKYSGQTGAAQ